MSAPEGNQFEVIEYTAFCGPYQVRVWHNAAFPNAPTDVCSCEIKPTCGLGARMFRTYEFTR